jgi:signal transduction histidine kinase
MSALSFLVGHRLSRKVVQPILRLVDDVSRKASEPHLEERETSFSEADYPPDEIGRLVRELDRFSHRLYGALQRESYFASDVSHELRTPVTVIMGAAEVLAELPGHSTMAEQRIEVIHRQAARMGQMLNAMLLLGREDSLESDPACSIADVIDEAVADCRPSLAGRPIELRVSCTAYPILAVERALVYVLVSNLLRNACAHTHQGTIEVRLHEDCFEVADTGIGIPDERFSEFMQRHVKGEHSQGHGLGLSIVARVCDRLGWRFSIASNAGQGTIARLHWSATTTA